jgi:hypothetical protein
VAILKQRGYNLFQSKQGGYIRNCPVWKFPVEAKADI